MVLMTWPGREDPIAIMQGVDARMIEAEAQLKAGDAAGALATLNARARTKSGWRPSRTPEPPLPGWTSSSGSVRSGNTDAGIGWATCAG